MKKMMPDRVEFIVLAAGAVLLGIVVSFAQSKDMAFAIGSIPLTMTAMLMGTRRHWRVMEEKKRAAVEVAVEDEVREAA